MKSIIVTNNKDVYEKYKDNFEIIFNENFTYLDVLETVRNKVHAGHELSTHPLSGSVKPNETPYKTVLISGGKGSLNFNSLQIIENSISTTKKFLTNQATPDYPQHILDDFRAVDFSLIENVIYKVYNI